MSSLDRHIRHFHHAELHLGSDHRVLGGEKGDVVTLVDLHALHTALHMPHDKDHELLGAPEEKHTWRVRGEAQEVEPIDPPHPIREREGKEDKQRKRDQKSEEWKNRLAGGDR